MRLLRIARKDLWDAIRPRQLQVMVLFSGLIGAMIGYVVGDDAAIASFFALAFLGPLVAVAFTQHAIAGKRESKELSVLLGLPFSRSDVVLGTFLGRTAFLLCVIVSTYLGSILVASATGSVPDPGTVIAGFAIVTVVSVIFISLSLGISAATESTSVASAGGFLAYFLFAFQLWSLIPDAILYAINGFEMVNEQPTWALAFDQLSPFATVRNVATSVAPDVAGTVPLAAVSVPEDPPLYMEPAVAGLVTVLWIVLPLVLGYRRFEQSDL